MNENSSPSGDRDKRAPRCRVREVVPDVYECLEPMASTCHNALLFQQTFLCAHPEVRRFAPPARRKGGAT